MSDGYIGMINCPACMSLHPANHRCELTTDQRIRDLEREVGRLKAAIVDMEGSLKEAKLFYVQGEADRADAARFRWWMRNRWTWGASNFPDSEIIARIDAAMAKDPQQTGPLDVSVSGPAPSEFVARQR